MSLWFRTRDKDGNVHHVSVPFEPLSVIALVGFTVLMLLPFLQMYRSAVLTSPTGTSAVIISLLLVGASLFTLAKFSVIYGGRLVSFGSREMSRAMRPCYYIGYSLLALGTVLILFFIAVVSSV